MCLFDAEPIWRLENESECKGQAHSIYYFFLGFAHFYFLVEFVVRTIVTKVPLASLKTFDSFIEILTTVPYFLSLIIIRQVSGYDNENVYWVQMILIFDQLRLFTYPRYCKFVTSELKFEILQIIGYIVSIAWFMTFFIQFIENEYHYR